MKKRITFDYESQSACDLKRTGAYKYSLHPTTRMTCLAFKIHNEPKIYFLDFKMINTPWKQLPEWFRGLWLELIMEGYEFSGHNVFFDMCLYKNVAVKRLGWPDISFKQFRCTAAKAASCALPRNLAGAGEALKLVVQKDWRGHQAVMKTCKPTRQWLYWVSQECENRAFLNRRIWEQNQPDMFITPESDPKTFEVLYLYCKIDVKSEEELDDALPDLSPTELELWQHNQRKNWRGLRIDIPTVEKILEIMATEETQKRRELDTLTMGLVQKPGSIRSIMDFLALEGVKMPNLRAKTVDDKLEGYDISNDMRALLELRKALSKTSTKKYRSFVDRAMPDHRCRDIVLYHGDSTGREGGAGIQPKNFPRGLLKVDKTRPYAAVENIIECDHEMLNLLYGPSLGVLFSAVLRNMIIPSDNHQLYVADFSKVEVAVLWWLARNKPGLKALREGKDPYRYQDMMNRDVPYEETPTEGDEYQLAKAQVLANGFGQGANKFMTTAWDIFRLKLSLKQSRLAVKNYREANEAVPKMWENVERAAINAVTKGGEFEAGRCKFIYDPSRFYGGIKFLWAELPSGRRLAYASPQVSWRVKEYEVFHVYTDSTGEPILDKNGNEQYTVEKKKTKPTETLEFWAVNPKTKKWNLERTWGGTLTENVTQATARDLTMPAGLRLEKAGFRDLLSIHDEAVHESSEGQSLDEFVRIMCEQPAWAPGLPISAKGWIGPRYRK